jgi:hypothetical protein
LRALIAAVLLAGACREVIDHTPAGICSGDNDCACGEDCYVPDGGDIAVCGPRIHTSCASIHECSDAGMQCLHLVRDAGVCNFTQCQ